MTDVLTQVPPPRHCRVCGCTDAQACPGGCSWVPAEHNLCDGLPCHLLVVAWHSMTAMDFAGEHDLPNWKWTFVPIGAGDRMTLGLAAPVIALAPDWQFRSDRAQLARVLRRSGYRPFPATEAPTT